MSKHSDANDHIKPNLHTACEHTHRNGEPVTGVDPQPHRDRCGYHNPEPQRLADSNAQRDATAKLVAEPDLQQHRSSNDHGKCNPNRLATAGVHGDGIVDSIVYANPHRHAFVDPDSISDPHADLIYTHTLGEPDSTGTVAYADTDRYANPHVDDRPDGNFNSHPDSDARPDSNTHSHVDADARPDCNLNPHTDTDADDHRDGDADSYPDSDGPADGDSDSNAHADGLANGNSDTHIHPDARGDGNCHSYAYAYGRRDRYGVADADSDRNANGVSNPKPRRHTNAIVPVDQHVDTNTLTKCDTNGNSKRHPESDANELAHAYANCNREHHPHPDRDALTDANAYPDGANTNAHADVDRAANPNRNGVADGEPYENGNSDCDNHAYTDSKRDKHVGLHSHRHSHSELPVRQHYARADLKLRNDDDYGDHQPQWICPSWRDRRVPSRTRGDQPGERRRGQRCQRLRNSRRQ